MNKKGQVAIFVIVAIVIVGLIAAFYFLYPKIRSGEINIPGLTAKQASPSSFLQSCIGDSVKSSMQTLSKQGGYLNPTGYIEFNKTKIKYLCYTTDNFKTCTVQEPFIKNHFEAELKQMVKPNIDKCFSDLKKNYGDLGYTITPSSIQSDISIVPGKIQIKITSPITITKTTSETYNSLDVSVNSEMYKLLSVAGNIVEFEAYYGDSDPDVYVNYYPDLRVFKLRLDDGTKIYTIQNAVTKEEFTFASRSLVWPSGYGLTA